MKRSLFASQYTRRSFLIYAAGSFLLPGSTINLSAAETTDEVKPPRNAVPASTRRPVAPLYCIAYITPDAPGQGGQEAAVARYPLAIVPQEDRSAFRRWRDAVRTLNPNIVLLGYQMVHEEPLTPGPGHDELRKASHSWCSISTLSNPLPTGADCAADYTI